MTVETRPLLCWWGVSALSLAGIGVSTYLSIIHMSGHGLACGPSSGCGVVAASRYAAILGIPVAVIGVAGYGALLMASLAVVGFQDPPLILRRGLLLMAGAGVAFSAYLTGIQEFVLHAFCVYCVTSASLMVLILVLTAVATWLDRNGRGRVRGLPWA